MSNCFRGDASPRAFAIHLRDSSVAEIVPRILEEKPRKPTTGAAWRATQVVCSPALTSGWGSCVAACSAVARMMRQTMQRHFGVGMVAIVYSGEEQAMRLVDRYTLTLAGLALAPALSLAQTAGAGLIDTDHDFTTNTDLAATFQTPAGAEGTVTSGADIGLCTFCHTPHKAYKTQLLWNHTLSSQTFSWDVAQTTAGTNFASFGGQTYNGPSAKCLSCHDGTVAIGDVAWFREVGPGGGQGVGTAIYNTATMATLAPNVMVVGPSAGLTGTLSGNHPVAMPYPYGQVANTYNGITGGANLVLSEWQASPVNVKLYHDAGGGSIVGGAAAGTSGIECSSCHDPHNKQTLDGWFLRGRLTGNTQASGYICLQCHIK